MTKFKIGDWVRLKQRVPPEPVREGWIADREIGKVLEISYASNTDNNGNYYHVDFGPKYENRIRGIWEDQLETYNGLEIMLEVSFPEESGGA